MEEQELASSSTLKPGGGRGRGKYNAVPRSERKSLEVFGGAPASARYLPGAGASFSGATVPEGEEQNEPAPPRIASPPWKLESPRIDPPWSTPTRAANPAAPSRSFQQQTPAALSSPMWSVPKPQTPQSAPKPRSGTASKPSPLHWPEINLDIPEYKPKPVIDADETTRKPIAKHQRSSSDTMRNPLPDLDQERQSAINKEERQNAINKLKQQVTNF